MEDPTETKATTRPDHPWSGKKHRFPAVHLSATSEVLNDDDQSEGFYTSGTVTIAESKVTKEMWDFLKLVGVDYDQRSKK